MSNFNYSAVLTEAILLGNLAMRAGEKMEVEAGTGRRKRKVTVRKIDWDGANMRATNSPEANQLLQPAYRKGWSL